MNKKAPAKSPTSTKNVKAKDLAPDTAKAIKGGMSSVSSKEQMLKR